MCFKILILFCGIHWLAISSNTLKTKNTSQVDPPALSNQNHVPGRSGSRSKILDRQIQSDRIKDNNRERQAYPVWNKTIP